MLHKLNSSTRLTWVCARRKSPFEGVQGGMVKDGETYNASLRDVLGVLSSNSLCLEAVFLGPCSF